MLRSGLTLCAVIAIATVAPSQPDVRILAANLPGPRPLEETTRTAAIRDYLKSWESMKSALEQNRAGLLDSDFTGSAHSKLAKTIQQQSELGIRTKRLDRTHDLQIVFYSPDGLSLELIDKVEYDMQVIDHDKAQPSQRTRARFVVVLTPAEERWKVRIFQESPAS